MATIKVTNVVERGSFSDVPRAVSLATSKKARRVAQTEIGLGSQNVGDEMFGSSRIARRVVRWSLSLMAWVRRVTPLRVRAWFHRRFNVDDTIMDQGAVESSRMPPPDP